MLWDGRRINWTKVQWPRGPYSADNGGRGTLGVKVVTASERGPTDLVPKFQTQSQEVACADLSPLW